jgi:NTP pyrophosphatase (non-canonical NTP hydrolase)
MNDRDFGKAYAAGEDLQFICHQQAKQWWIDKDGEDVRMYAPKHLMTWIASKLMLSVTELAEGMEGLRKNQMDDHLKHRKMLEVELGDCVIRCFDLAGGLGFNLGGAIAEKLRYNSVREDHKPENRNAVGGKAI